MSAATVARADGEAGLVIEHGDGTVETFCVAFEGTSIEGDQLLRRAGVAVEQFSGLVCSLGTNRDEGCPGASSFESCACKCTSAGNCVYWAFFTQQYGKSWVYSSLGFRLQQAKDGDLQGWKWGRGGPQSAAAPAAISFEQVCGHAPRGGRPPPSTLPPTSTASIAATPPEAPPGASVVVTDVPMSPVPGASSGAAALPSITLRTPDAAANTTPRSAGDTDGDGPRDAVAFALVAGGLLAAIAGAVVWSRRHGG